MDRHVRTARWNRFRKTLGLGPLPRTGQVWEVQYSGWNKTRVFVYYLLLQKGEPYTYNGKTTERWHVFDLEKGCFYASDEMNTYAMPFEYQNGEDKCPYYRLIMEAP